MNKLVGIFSIMIFAISCASLFRSPEEWAKINDENAPNILKNIKSGNNKVALQEFVTGVKFDSYDYSIIHFHDSDGLRLEFNIGKEPSNIFGRNDNLMKQVIVMLSKLQKCIDNSSKNELKPCLKKFMGEYSGKGRDGDVFSFEYDVANVPRSCSNYENSDRMNYFTSKREECFKFESLISNICNKPLSLVNDETQSTIKQNEVQWGGFLFTYAFNSSFSKTWAELKDLRNSPFCK